MLTLLQIVPFLFAASVAISIYLVYMLMKLRESEVPRRQETSADQKSLTARSMYELALASPDFAPLVEIMRNQVRRNREEFQRSGQFLAETESLLGRGKVDALSFGSLYDLYQRKFLSKDSGNN